MRVEGGGLRVEGGGLRVEDAVGCLALERQERLRDSSAARLVLSFQQGTLCHGTGGNTPMDRTTIGP